MATSDEGTVYLTEVHRELEKDVRAAVTITSVQPLIDFRLTTSDVSGEITDPQSCPISRSMKLSNTLTG